VTTVAAGSVIVLFALIGVALTMLTLPGIWLALLVALLVDIFWAPAMLSWQLLTAVGAIAIGAEFAEFFSSAAGSGRERGSGRGMIASLVGAAAGMLVFQILIPVPIVGAIIGGVVGAGVGAFAGEKLWAGRPWVESWRSGRGAAVGRALSIIVKTGFAVAAAVVLTAGVLL